MHKRRILIVDDESGFNRLLKLVLERTGRYLVREEDDATTAVAVARQFEPDLILLDFVMPKIDGGSVARRIRADAQLGETPIVFLSATVLKTEGDPPMQIAGCPAIPKPIGVEDLVEAIEANLVGTAVAS